MKAQLMLERIGDAQHAEAAGYARMLDAICPGAGGRPPSTMPWVAEVKGPDPRFGVEREFLPYNKDFAEANSRGSRGVRAVYILESGRAYEVKEKTSWSKSRRYFCTVNDAGEIIEITRDDALTIAAHREIDKQVKKWQNKD